MKYVLTWLCIAVNDFLSRTKTNVYLRTFAPIATAHFSAHVTHSSCIADYQGKQTWQLVINKDFPQEWNAKACGIMDPGLLRNVTQLVTVWIDNRFENITAILLSRMLGDPHFSFRRSLSFLILSILIKNKKICTWEVTSISLFMLSCDRSFLS